MILSTLPSLKDFFEAAYSLAVCRKSKKSSYPAVLRLVGLPCRSDLVFEVCRYAAISLGMRIKL